MHFWINKGSQGCGFNGRYVPPSIYTGTRRGGVHPKPMVTPVHRFQSIESVASGGRRHSRGPAYHTRFPAPPPSSHIHHNSHDIAEYHSNSSRATINPRIRRISLEHIANGRNISLTRVNASRTPNAKIKCGVGAAISLVPFFVLAIIFYSDGSNMGMKSLTFWAIILVVSISGGIVAVFQACNRKRERRESAHISSEQNEIAEESSQLPQHPMPVHAELPPPPYHIAVMLPTQHEHLTIIQDSPPPTYEKAVN